MLQSPYPCPVMVARFRSSSTSWALQYGHQSAERTKMMKAPFRPRIVSNVCVRPCWSVASNDGICPPTSRPYSIGIHSSHPVPWALSRSSAGPRENGNQTATDTRHPPSTPGASYAEKLLQPSAVEAHDRLPIDDRHRRGRVAHVHQFLKRVFIGAYVLLGENNPLQAKELLHLSAEQSPGLRIYDHGPCHCCSLPALIIPYSSGQTSAAVPAPVAGSKNRR